MVFGDVHCAVTDLFFGLWWLGQLLGTAWEPGVSPKREMWSLR